MQEELLSKEYGNSYVFRRTGKCSLQVQKYSSLPSVRFVIIEKEGFTGKLDGHKICALLFFTEFVWQNSSPDKFAEGFRSKVFIRIYKVERILK